MVPDLCHADAEAAHAVFEVHDAVTDPDGEPISGTLSKHLYEGDSIHFMRCGEVLVELGTRDGRYMIRTRNRNHETLQNFSGLPIFDYDPECRVSGHFGAQDSPRMAPSGSFREDAHFTVELGVRWNFR